MHLPSRHPLLSSLIALTSLASAVTLDCEKVPVGGNLNLKNLGGPRFVHWETAEDKLVVGNWTFMLDICDKLKKTKGKLQCPTGTQVCGIEVEYSNVTGGHVPKEPIPIAGEFTFTHGRSLNPVWTLLSDTAEGGVRLEMEGGEDHEKKPQMAVIDFVCDPSRTGLEGAEPDDREKLEGEGLQQIFTREDDDDGDDDDNGGETEDEGKSLTVLSYKNEDVKKKTMRVLRLNWRTKEVCEASNDEQDAGHWGFFTWFIIILFLAIAAYLIFGAWLNYNRYGARGWDLLPHGDAIRDLPYIMKDWARRVANTLRGDSRGGYSAV